MSAFFYSDFANINYVFFQFTMTGTRSVPKRGTSHRKLRTIL